DDRGGAVRGVLCRDPFGMGGFMIEGFKRRRWWAAALINLVFGPFIGMLYLGRGRIAFAYLIAGFVLGVFIALVWFPGLVHAQGQWATSFAIQLPFNLIGAIHGAVLARRHPREVLPGYSRWYWLAAIFFLVPLVAFGIRTFLVQPF